MMNNIDTLIETYKNRMANDAILEIDYNELNANRVRL